jgi:hypothetical protein
VFGMNSYSYTIDHTAEAFLTNLAGRGYPRLRADGLSGATCGPRR